MLRNTSAGQRKTRRDKEDRMKATAYLSDCGGRLELEGDTFAAIRHNAISWQKSVNFCQGKTYSMVIDYGVGGKEKIGWRR
jgi:hypothetical protein